MLNQTQNQNYEQSTNIRTLFDSDEEFLNEMGKAMGVKFRFEDNKEEKQMQNYELIPFKNEAGKTVKLSFFENDIWATQQQMADYFEVDRSVISKHLQNIFQDGELDKNEVCANFAQNDNHAGFRPLKESLTPNKYKLDAMISVGFRVSSKKGTNFRIRANQIIRERMQQEFEKRYDLKYSISFLILYIYR